MQGDVRWYLFPRYWIKPQQSAAGPRRQLPRSGTFPTRPPLARYTNTSIVSHKSIADYERWTKTPRLRSTLAECSGGVLRPSTSRSELSSFTGRQLLKRSERLAWGCRRYEPAQEPSTALPELLLMNGREPTGKSARLAWFCRSYKLIRPRPAPFYGTWALYTTPVTPSNTTTDANDPAEPGDPTIALDEVQSAAPLVPQRSAAQPQAFASQKASNGIPRPCSNLVTQQQQSLNTIEGKTDETLRPSSTGLHEAYQTSNHVSDDDSGIGMHSKMQQRKSPKIIQVRVKPRKALKKSATAILKHSSKTARVTSKSMSVSRKSAKPRRPSSAVSSAGESPGAKNDLPLSHEADRETNGPSDNVSDRESDVSRDQVQDKGKSSASIELRKL